MKLDDNILVYLRVSTSGQIISKGKIPITNHGIRVSNSPLISAQSIDLSSGYITFDSDVALDSNNDWTISFFYKKSNVTEYDVIFGNMDNSIMSIQNSDQNNNHLGMRLGGNSYDLGCSQSLNVQHHVAVVNDTKASKVKLFLDGVLCSDASKYFSISLNAIHNWGYSEIGTPGIFDELVIVKNKALWTQNFTAPTSYIFTDAKLLYIKNNKVYGVK